MPRIKLLLLKQINEKEEKNSMKHAKNLKIQGKIGI